MGLASYPFHCSIVGTRLRVHASTSPGAGVGDCNRYGANGVDGGLQLVWSIEGDTGAIAGVLHGRSGFGRYVGCGVGLGATAAMLPASARHEEGIRLLRCRLWIDRRHLVLSGPAAGGWGIRLVDVGFGYPGAEMLFEHVEFSINQVSGGRRTAVLDCQPRQILLAVQTRAHHFPAPCCQNSRVCLVGPNGIGKSTLLKIVYQVGFVIAFAQMLGGAVFLYILVGKLPTPTIRIPSHVAGTRTHRRHCFQEPPPACCSIHPAFCGPTGYEEVSAGRCNLLPPSPLPPSPSLLPFQYKPRQLSQEPRSTLGTHTQHSRCMSACV